MADWSDWLNFDWGDQPISLMDPEQQQPAFDFGGDGGGNLDIPDLNLTTGGSWGINPADYSFGGAEPSGFEIPTSGFNLGTSLDLGSLADLSGAPNAGDFMNLESQTFQMPSPDVSTPRPDLFPETTGAPSPMSETPAPEPSAMTKILEGLKAGAKNAGVSLAQTAQKNPLQTGMGLLGAGTALAGMMKSTPTLKVPNRSGPIQMSPAEQAAANQLAMERAKASGTLAERGYAGEEGIRQTVNDQIQAALTGQTDLVSPQTTRALADAKRQLEDRLRQEIGPGFATSTAGRNALDNFTRMAQATLDDERERKLATRNTMGLQRSQFTQGLQKTPSELAALELSTLAPLGEREASRQFQVDATNQARALAAKQGAITGGTQLVSLASLPYLMQLFGKSAKAPIG